jgi:DNA-binding transcriptional ArsR family regulator
VTKRSPIVSRVIDDDDRVFKALADATRRFLLDRLFERDGRTLLELETDLDMTRFGVMKHLRVLEDARLVLARRSGRNKLHFLNPVPIRLIHDRWIDKFTERRVSALTELKAMLEKEQDEMTTTKTTQVYEVYIKASPQKVWDAITTPEWTVRYGYQGPVEYELRSGGAYRARATPPMLAMGVPEVVIDGEVIEADPPRRLVHTYRFLFNEQMKAEGFTRVTWEIEPSGSSFSRLTVTHELDGAPIMAAMVASKFSEQGTGGWSWILSDLKSLLETGSPLAA